MFWELPDRSAYLFGYHNSFIWGNFCCNHWVDDVSHKLPRLPNAWSRSFGVTLQAWSQTPAVPAKYSSATKIGFVTLSQSNLLKEKASSCFLFHCWRNKIKKKAEAGLPKLQSCFVLRADFKRFVKGDLTNDKCHPPLQVEILKSALSQFCSCSTRTYGKYS